ncbi:MAG: (2Fe-2S) ferredoxin domain-containing protein [Bacteroidales bacterium]|nr:(2Fe-2S) ferredoxin domain-containing protein [Bacteroidales bacterium]
MAKITNLEDLRKIRQKMQPETISGHTGKDAAKLIRIKVAMATCSIASGSRETLNYIVDELDKRNLEATVTQTGCMGYCYAEPTIEVTLPDREPVLFGYVDVKKADEIIEKYVKGGMLVDGIIPVNYKRIDE